MNRNQHREPYVDGRHLSPDLTWRRVNSPAICPLCRHDNRGRQGQCDHFVSKADSHDAVPAPGPRDGHVIAQGYAGPSDPSLLGRYFVYRDTV